MCAYGAGLQPDRFPEERGAFIESLLRKANGTEHRIGPGTGVWVTERTPRLPVRLFQASLLNKRNGTLEGLAPVNTDGRSRPARISRYRKPDKQEAEQQ